MGFFSSLTGSSQKRALWQKAQSDLAAGKKLGESISGAYDGLADEQTKGQQAILDSFGGAFDANTQGYEGALGFLNPYLTGGQGANTQYLDALGVNGNDAQNAFYQNEQDSAGFQAGLGAGVDDLMARYAATNTGRVGEDGLARSGRVLKGLQGYGNRYLNDYVNSKLNHLSGLQGQGYNAAQNAANLTSNYYGNLGNLGLAQGQAQNQYYALPAGTRAQGQLGAANALYQGQTNYNNGIAEGSLAKANATNNLFSQGLSLLTSPIKQNSFLGWGG